MPVRPPSLRAIAAFEAAARHGSFTKAADELNLTQSAISHAIRSLESRLGLELFERFGRHVTLTEAGRGFVSRLRLSLNLISEAFETPARPARGRLVVAAPPAVAENILASRVSEFLRIHPDREIDLRTHASAAQVSEGGVDVAVLFTAGAYAGLAQRSLGSERLIVVGAPGRPAPRRLSDLADTPLIHQPEHPWRLWFDQAGIDAYPTATLTVDCAQAALALARNGAGLALAPGRWVSEDLRSGRLQRHFDIEAPLPEEYLALWNPASTRLSQIRAFVDWLADTLPEPQALAANAA